MPYLDGAQVALNDIPKLPKDKAWGVDTRLPEVIVYTDRNFNGHDWRTNLSYNALGDTFQDQISSIIVVSGTWRFYRDANCSGDYWDLPPGYYAWVEDHGIPNDVISSFKSIKW